MNNKRRHKPRKVGHITPCAPSSQPERKSPERGCVRSTSRSTSPRRNASKSSVPAQRLAPAAAGRSDTATLRRQAREFIASLPTQLERDTLLTPEWIAESVVQEVERFLQADLPANFAERLAAKAYHLYSCHRQFKQSLNRPGNRGRDNLFMYMRHWTAAWLKREHCRLYRMLPWSYALGIALPVTAPGVPPGYLNPQTEAAARLSHGRSLTAAH